MQALQQNEFQELVHRYPRAIMLTTTDARIAYVNRMFSSITGYDPQEVVGRAPSVLSSGVHSKKFYQAMWESLLNEGHWEGVIWNRRKNGETYPQWLSISKVEIDRRRLFASMFIDVGDLAAGDERLASLAYYDPLTELPNRALFQEFLKARVSIRREAHKCCAILFIDLDFFKSINDLHGHECGDRVLQQAAVCIQSALRTGDMVARLSGDEFAAIVELDSSEEVDVICQRMTQAFQVPLMCDRKEYFLSASIGVALYPKHGETGSTLLQNADHAMYTAKLSGRGCYRMYNAEDTEQGRFKQRLSEALIASLKSAPEEFSVVYQPQYQLATGQIVGLEALFRWNHPHFGAVSPDDFVPIAEQRGYIQELTEGLVRCILADLPVAADDVPSGLKLAINISARQINDSRLEGTLAPLFARLRQIGWLPEIEITETHLMHLSSACLAWLHEFGQQGVTVALDDFGTGYSSLAYLHKLPVQVLKIDRQFIKRLGGEGNDTRIVSAILAMAEALDLDVVAEGIENEDQYRQLCELNCHRGQGYLMSKPVPWHTLHADLACRYQ
ncbi:EAL domain-containing protein [Marinobacter sp. CHS3-4]|uniref:putative bifunctional diguanylate cyclase/phosphodiesterase n=1 Tax=Marinobacter sp. CHS3-4 TaxID=3045174 RepID=UPI0024B5A8D4|nr:EAL domain-containing protein [Marinobacter sp. CHS3-4]MDI9244215.1 EAL domain-containing protein [Marinobacter sp. CHS3-4]